MKKPFENKALEAKRVARQQWRAWIETITWMGWLVPVK